MLEEWNARQRRRRLRLWHRVSRRSPTAADLQLDHDIDVLHEWYIEVAEKGPVDVIAEVGDHIYWIERLRGRLSCDEKIRSHLRESCSRLRQISDKCPTRTFNPPPERPAAPSRLRELRGSVSAMRTKTKMPAMQCYQVRLQTTGVLRDTADLGDCHYISVENGFLYVVAVDLAEVGRHFPNAISIQRVGVGYALAGQAD